ncbi:ribonuclease HII [Leucobacter sp. OH2974_COT-288]|nr:ribonuclease HII [Leucobacter sp. OH2974_COT-288]
MAGLNNCTKDPTLEFELELLLRYQQIIALDEAGRGALAGPVAVGAQLFTAATGEPPAGIRDSKLLSEKKREALYDEVLAWETGTVCFAAAQTIDDAGLTRALGHAAAQAITAVLDPATLNVQQTVILLDGKHNWVTAALPQQLREIPVITKVGADRACLAVAAASIRAKVARDRLLRQLHEEYPGYGWDTNKGYGSAAHTQAIRELGATPQHRLTWLKVPADPLF